jgi:thymidylate kinase
MDGCAHMTLSAIAGLLEDLNASGIRYCHWKSNYNLEGSLTGSADLDLLVDPTQGDLFRLMLAKHSVKPILAAPDRVYPSIEHHLGLDQETGSLFHLHVHYRLILGEQFVKSYRLPLEQAFQDSAHIENLIRIPSPELEFTVLSIRALLKYRDRDAIKDTLSIRTPGLPRTILKEFEYLRGRTNKERLQETVQAQVGFLSPEIVLGMLSIVGDSPRSGRLLYRLRRTLRRELAPFQRHSRWRAMRTYFKVLIQRRIGFPRSYSYKKIPTTGGKVIAVVGADGAGKSTLTWELYEWLGHQLRVAHYYMGSQEPSRLTRFLHNGYRVALKLRITWRNLIGQGRSSGGALDWLQRLSRNLYHLSVGRDRYQRYIAGLRQAARGAIVLCDRYPLEAIHQVMESRPMDGPQIATEAGDEMGRLTRKLSEWEQAIYRKIHPPDHILVLHVSPEVSQQRKPDHQWEMIETKSRALRHMDTQNLHVIEIDADQSYEQVLLQSKAAIWKLL